MNLPLDIELWPDRYKEAFEERAGIIEYEGNFPKWKAEIMKPARNRFGISSSASWSIEPNVGRVAHGVPSRVDRIKGLGNAVIPQIAEWIGRRIVAACEAEE